MHKKLKKINLTFVLYFFTFFFAFSSFGLSLINSFKVRNLRDFDTFKQRSQNTQQDLDTLFSEIKNTQTNLPAKKAFILSKSELEELLKFACNQFQVPMLPLPEIRTLTREQYKQEVIKNIDTEPISDEELNLSLALMKMFGFVDSGLTKEEYLQNQISSIASFPVAFFEPSNDRLTFIEGVSDSPEYNKYVAVHELAHYVQNKNFNLKEKSEKLSEEGTTDQYFTYKAIVEGSAEYVTGRYIAKMSTFERDKLQKAVEEVYRQAQSTPDTEDGISNFDMRTAEFMYNDGLKFMNQVNNQSIINNFLRNPTLTSEQIYNPSLLLVSNQSPNIDFNLNYSTLKFNEEDVLGQVGCNLLTYALEGDLEETCYGWEGDKTKFYTVENNPSDLLLVYVSKWESNFDFYEAKKGFETVFDTVGTNHFINIHNNHLVIMSTTNETLDLLDIYNSFSLTK